MRSPLPGDGEGEAEEERGLLRVALGGEAEGLQRVLAADERRQGLDGRCQPVVRHVRQIRRRAGEDAVGGEVRQERLGVSVQLRPGVRIRAQVHAQGQRTLSTSWPLTAPA
ncbi:hypothetical protein GCM10018955_20060 [Planomonospora venezuelensis]